MERKLLQKAPTMFKRTDVTLGNWRMRPYSSWSFQNVSELVPSAIVHGTRHPEAVARDLGPFARLQVENLSGEQRDLASFLAESESDSLVVMRRGEIVAEWSAGHNDPAKPHIIFSISKSVTGLLAGMLAARGQLSLDDLVSRYVPETLGSAYGDLPIRHLLDMTVAIDFDESYLDRKGDYDRYRRAMLWNPERPDEPTMTLPELMFRLPRAGHPHGSRHAYRSPNADMAALVIEAASGMRYADLFDVLLWRPMGAYGDAHITVDRAGNPRASGGISMTARDLARLGELVRTGGGGILPPALIDELRAGGDKQVWAEGDQGFLFPGGSYRHFWYRAGSGEICGMGIHGQSVWIDAANETVVVRMASESLPINDALDQKVIAMLKKICAA